MSVSGYTAKYGLNLIDFDSNPWHTDDWANINAIDALIYTAMVAKVPMYVAAGVANAVTVTAAGVTAYSDLLSVPFSFIAPFTNTGAVTVNVNGLGAIALKNNTTALTAGMMTATQVYCVVYDGTQFRVMWRSGEITAQDVSNALGYIPYSKGGGEITGDVTMDGKLTVVGSSIIGTSLAFGAEDATHVALYRSTTSLKTRLGDNTADADFTAKGGTFSGQLLGKGTTTNDNASAGQIGEYQEQIVLSGGAIALTSVTAANITSLSLTAGDWDVAGSITTTSLACTVIQGSIGTTSASISSPPNNNGALNYSVGGGGTLGGTFPIGPKRISVAVTTTVYLVTSCQFGSATSAYGDLRARRVR